MNKFIYIEELGEHPIKWIEHHCVHYIGEKKNKPFLLEEFQKDILRELFGWRLEKDRRYLKHTTVWLEIPRGNGKSTFATAMGLYIAFGLGLESSKVYCFASSLKQSKESVFDPAKHMAESINENFDMGLRLYHSTVKDPETGSEFILMSADWKGAHSLVGTAFIIDEIHLHSDDRLYAGVQSGDSKRTDFSPLIIVLTTSGTRHTFGHEKHLYAKRIQDGLIKDDSWLVRIYSAGDQPEGDDEYYFRPETWEAANPGFKYINGYKFAQKAQVARNSSSSLNTFLRYNLNIWVGSVNAWIPAHRWAKCKGKVNFSELEGERAYCGLYVSKIKDIGAFCMFFPEKKVLWWRYFCPETSSNERKEALVGYADWVKKGWIVEIPGDVLDDEAVTLRIIALSRKVKMKVILYHAAESTSKVNILAENGLNLESCSVSSYTIMSAASKKLEEMVLKQEISHGGNPVSSYMVDSVELIKKDEAIKPSAEESTDNISGVFAAVMAIASWMNAEPEKVSVYEERGIRVL